MSDFYNPMQVAFLTENCEGINETLHH